MKLSGKDRLIIQGVLPDRGNFVQLKLMKDIIAKIELSQEEGKEIGMRTEGNQVFWNDAKAALAQKDVKFTSAELELITENITKMDREGQITLIQLETFELMREAAKVTKE